MAQALITERYETEIRGVLDCYDRIVISGQLQPLCYAKGMTKYLYNQGVRIFDYTQFAEPLRDAIGRHWGWSWRDQRPSFYSDPKYR